LEERKRNTSEFVASSNGELSPIDAMAVRVNQWRSECRRKEKETLLLYQRFVDKFGATGHVQVPGSSKTTTNAAGGGSTIHKSNISKSNTPSSSSSMPHTPPSWARAPSPTGTPDTPRAAAPPPAVTPTLVPAVAQRIERAIQEHVEHGAMALPSMEMIGPDHTFQDIHQKTEMEFKNYYRRLLEEKGIDAKSSDHWSERLGQERQAVYTGPGAFHNHHGVQAGSLLRTVGETTPYKDSRMGLLRDLSPVRKMPEIREDGQVVNQEEEEDLYTKEQYDDDGVFAAQPYFVHDDLDELTVVSGLTTVNSAETRRILQDCQRSVATFLKDEHNAIRQMMLEDSREEENTTTESCCTNLNSVTKVAADQAEGMVRQMKSILDDFTLHHKHLSNTNSNTNDDDDSCAAQKSAGRGYKTSNPDEEWVAYYDESYQREYYHEKNTNRTQWEPPEPDATSVSMDNNSASAADLMIVTHDQVMPEHSLQYSFRYAQYRRKQKTARRRKKRRVLVGFLAVLLLVAGAYYSYYHQHHNGTLSSVGTTNNVSGFEPITAVVSPPSQQHQLQPTTRITLVESLRLLEDQKAATKQHGNSRAPPTLRPWACNIPLAYIVHPRCFRLASEHPVFDLQALVNALMQ
jgi:hypothetical protein